MAAAYGAAIFQIMGSAERFYKDIYLSDAANTAVFFDAGAGASSTSVQEFRPTANCVLVDVAITTGTAKTKIQVNRNDQGTGTILRSSLHLDSVVSRPYIGVGFAAGQKVTMIELT